MRKALIAGAVLAAACTPNKGKPEVAQVEAQSASPGFISRDHGATTVPEETTTTTTTTTEPPPTTTTTEAPQPILCARLPHPAHHSECPSQPARNLQPVATTAVVQATSSGWSIPTYIVMCESGGNWDAYNASGASGPYQLMPMHFGGELAMNQSRAAQHAKAAELWAGGAGKSHWAACL